jgi:hypothetical protein
MKIFRSKSEIAKVKDSQEIQETIQSFENTLEEIRHIIRCRGTMFKNAEKKLQEFQDTIYAMLIEENYSRKKKSHIRKNDEDNKDF